MSSPNSHENDDWLDEALRTSAGEADYIADGGFTARVMTSLPAPHGQRDWVTPVVLASAVGVGCAITLAVVGGQSAVGMAKLAGRWMIRPIDGTVWPPAALLSLVFAASVLLVRGSTLRRLRRALDL